MITTANPWRIWLLSAIALGLIFGPIPRIARAVPLPAPPEIECRYVVVYVSAAEAAALTNGSINSQALARRYQDLANSGTPLSAVNLESMINAQTAAGEPIPAPVSPTGDPIPPPIKLPDGPNGEPNPWRPVPGTGDRPVKWVPTISIPGQSQPGVSWDGKDGHWDVDNGQGLRTRWLPDGTGVGPDHQVYPKPVVPPSPFTGIDLTQIVATGILGAIGVVLVLVVVVVYTFLTGGGGALAKIASIAAVPITPAP